MLYHTILYTHIIHNFIFYNILYYSCVLPDHSPVQRRVTCVCFMITQRHHVSQSCISKVIWRQGIGSIVRNSYVSTLTSGEKKRDLQSAFPDLDCRAHLHGLSCTYMCLLRCLYVYDVPCRHMPLWRPWHARRRRSGSRPRPSTPRAQRAWKKSETF